LRSRAVKEKLNLLVVLHFAQPQNHNVEKNFIELFLFFLNIAFSENIKGEDVNKGVK
jgi:hypothetical protein